MKDSVRNLAAGEELSLLSAFHEKVRFCQDLGHAHLPDVNLNVRALGLGLLVIAAVGQHHLPRGVEPGAGQHALDVRGRSVVLKPNLVEFEPESSINTNPILVHAAYEAFESMKEHLGKANKLKLDDTAYRLGRLLRFDPQAEKFVGDDEADKLLTRPYRDRFVVPDQV